MLVLLMTATFSMAQDALTRYPVFTMNEAGSKFYRIPALTQTANGTLVAIADQRGSELGDLPNKISVVAKTSADGGKTWSDMVTIAQCDASAGNTYGDAAVVYDAETDKIVTVFVGNENYGSNCVGLWASNSSYPLRLYKSESSDNGVTWTTPEDISESIYNGIYGSKSSWIGMFAGSGSAVQLKKGEKAGRLMFVVAARNDNSWGGAMNNYAVYSDDHGATWNVSSMSACSNGDEAKIVELENGDLLMSIKNRNKGSRLMARSYDQGETWTNAAVNSNLNDPACNGDVVSYEADGKYYLIHSMPGSTSTRENVTVYLSLDGGKTWPISRCVYEGYSAYSTLQVLADGTIGIIVEEGKWDSNLPGDDGFNLAYYNFTLDWLMAEANFDAVELLQTAKNLIAKKGIGYPAEAPRAALQAAIDAAEANPSAENALALESAIAIYRSSDELTMPQVGKSYSFISRGWSDYYMYNNNGELALAAYSEGMELPEEAKFTCEYDENAAKYMFKTSDTAYYLAYPTIGGKGWLDNESLTGLETSASAVTQFEISKINIDGNVSATADELFGYVHLWGYRGYDNGKFVDVYGPIVVKSTGSFDGASGDYYDSNVSSVFTILPTEAEAAPERVKYTITVSASPAEGGTVTVNGAESAEIVEGSMANLVATVNSGYEFVNWTKGGEVVSTEKSVRVSVTESAEYVANYEELVVETEYSTYPGKNYGSRWLDSFQISNGFEVLDVKATDSKGPVYVNRTQSHILYVKPGSCISFPKFEWKGEWMHAYAYVDYDNDKKFNTDANNDGTTGGELVTYNYLGGKDINGKSASSQYACTSPYTNEYGSGMGLPAFKLPETLKAGDYRLRVVIAWDALVPDGYPDITGNCGILLDMILRVDTGEKYRINVSSSDAVNGEVYIGSEGVITTTVEADGTQTVVLNAVANEKCSFVNWTLNGEVVSTDAVYTTTAITENRDYVANFAPMYQLTSDLLGEGTIVYYDEEGNEISGRVITGTKVRVVVTAAEGYNMTYVQCGDEEIELEAPVDKWSMDIEVTSDVDVFAVFEEAEDVSVDSAVVDNVRVSAGNGMIVVEGYAGSVRVVSASGQVVSEGKAQVSVARGVYVVIAGEKVCKVIVK